MSLMHPRNERLRELLADRALQGLEANDDRELQELLAAEGQVDEDAYDFAAAAIDLAAMNRELDPVPPALLERLHADANNFAMPVKARVPSVAPVVDVVSPAVAGRVMPWLAAAAGVLLAIIAWWPGRPVDAAATYATLLTSPGSIELPWTNAAAGEGVSGSVVWNADRNEGVLRFSGLAVNDPRDIQYQLWIFDAGRAGYSDDIAVDGGVFDIDRATGDVYVPIRAALDIKNPSLFAITTEPPGGVVKHNAERDPERYRIILTAPVDA